jgi:Domain of unknown function (DUF4337)
MGIATLVRVGSMIGAGRPRSVQCGIFAIGNVAQRELAEKAQRDEAAREMAFHRYHWLELVVGALEIAIVLASVSVVTRIRSLAVGAGAIGIVAGLSGLAVAMGVL